jgi:hypothetical protein
MIAPLALFLAGPKARHITGQVLGIGGERLTSFPQPRPNQTAYRAGGWTVPELERLWESQFRADELVRYQRYFPTS